VRLFRGVQARARPHAAPVLRQGRAAAALRPGQPAASPAAHWSPERLAKAARNYAIEYVRNGVCELAATIGEADARELGGLAAR